MSAKQNTRVPGRKGSGKKEDDPCATRKIKCKTLVIHGGKYRTTFTKKFENRKKWVQPNTREIYSFIPGTIIDVNIHEGEVVQEGQPMMVLEAMKMMNTITIPHNGIIKKVHVSEGQKIPKNHLMVEFE